MAIICLACFPKRSVNLIFMRLLKQTYSEQKALQSVPPGLINKDAPIKFTTNKASKLKISEITGLDNEKKGSTYLAHIFFISFAVFLGYFCILREENDIDEILKGEKEPENDKIKLIQLKVQLNYCEKNNLPTLELKNKIKELEAKENPTTSPFKI